MKKLEIDKTKIMVWVKEDSISGNTLIGIEFPKTITVQRRIGIAFQLGRVDRSFPSKKTTVFTRIFKGELALLIDPKTDAQNTGMIYIKWLLEYFKIKTTA